MLNMNIPTATTVVSTVSQQQVNDIVNAMKKRPSQSFLLLQMYDYFFQSKEAKYLTLKEAADLFGVTLRSIQINGGKLRKAGLTAYWPNVTFLGIEVAKELKRQQLIPTTQVQPSLPNDEYIDIERSNTSNLKESSQNRDKTLLLLEQVKS